MKHGLLGAFMLLLASLSFGGEIHFVDSSLVSYSQATAWTAHTTSSSYTLSGRMFGLNLSADHTTTGSGVMNGSTAASVTVQMRVKWTGDPGETKPQGAAAYWTFQGSSAGQLIRTFRVGSTTTVTLGTSTVPDPCGLSTSQIFTATYTSYNSGPQTSLNNAFGEFEFHDEAGEWIGVGSFDIPLTVFATGTIPAPEFGAIDGSISSNLTLTKVGTWTVQ